MSTKFDCVFSIVVTSVMLLLAVASIIFLFVASAEFAPAMAIVFSFPIGACVYGIINHSIGLAQIEKEEKAKKQETVKTETTTVKKEETVNAKKEEMTDTTSVKEEQELENKEIVSKVESVESIKEDVITDITEEDTFSKD